MRKTQRLPEEILENIIDFALPDSASVVRSGRCAGGLQSLLLVNRQFSRITRSVHYSRPLRVYVTARNRVCDPHFTQRRWLEYSRLPWTRFRKLMLNFHPELLFTDLERNTTEVINQMKGDPFGYDLCSQAAYLSRLMRNTIGLCRSVAEGTIKMDFTFHNSCPFHDPQSYADPENPPVHHMPLWDTVSVCYVLSNFAWAMPSPWTNFDLRDMVRFPHFAWFAPRALGNLSAMRFKDALFSKLVRSTLRGSAEQDFGNQFISNVWGMTLGHWIVAHRFRQFLNYSVSPLGTIHDVNPENYDWYSDLSESCIGRIESCIQDISPHSEHFAHELDVLSKVLVRIHQTAFRIRNLNGIIVGVAEAPDTVITTARMRLYEQVFNACMHEIEMSKAEDRDGTAAPERHEEIRYMSAHLGRLTAAGMWDGKWRALHDERHYLVPDYADTGRYLHAVNS